jgi:hypothetical protein
LPETDADASGDAIKEIGLADQNFPFGKRGDAHINELDRAVPEARSQKTRTGRRFCERTFPRALGKADAMANYTATGDVALLQEGYRRATARRQGLHAQHHLR